MGWDRILLYSVIFYCYRCTYVVSISFSFVARSFFLPFFFSTSGVSFLFLFSFLLVLLYHPRRRRRRRICVSRYDFSPDCVSIAHILYLHHTLHPPQSLSIRLFTLPPSLSALPPLPRHLLFMASRPRPTWPVLFIRLTSPLHSPYLASLFASPCRPPHPPRPVSSSATPRLPPNIRPPPTVSHPSRLPTSRGALRSSLFSFFFSLSVSVSGGGFQSWTTAYVVGSIRCVFCISFLRLGC